MTTALALANGNKQSALVQALEGENDATADDDADNKKNRLFLALFQSGKSKIHVMVDEATGQEQEEPFHKMVRCVCEKTIAERFSYKTRYKSMRKLGSVGSKYISKYNVFASQLANGERIALKVKHIDKMYDTEEKKKKAFTYNMFELYFCNKLCTSFNPNIVRLQNAWALQVIRDISIYEVFLEFELCDGTLQEEIVKYNNNIPVVKMVSYIRQAFTALYFCHSRRVLHGDVKEENFLVNVDGTLKLCDFDMSRETAADHTVPFVVDCNDRRHLPPEIMLGVDFLTCTVDMFAMGCVIIKMACGTDTAFAETEFQKQINFLQAAVGPFQVSMFENAKNRTLLYPHDIEVVGVLNMYRNLPRDVYFIDMITRLLDINPSTRMSSFASINHPFMHSHRFIQ